MDTRAEAPSVTEGAMFSRLAIAWVLTMTATPEALPADRLEAETLAWHARRLEQLKREDGWLTLVNLHWLDEGETVAGSAEDAALKLPPSAPRRLGTFTRRGSEVRFTPAAGMEISAGGKRFQGGAVRTDAAGAPDVLRHDTLQLLAIVRGERVGIRVRDSAAETRRNFHGIPRFPVRAEWRKEARFESAAGGRTVSVPNVLGEVEDVPLAGTATFTHEGKEHRLEATSEGDKLFLVFGDLTNRKETYGAGRFLYADAPVGGRVILDFNRACNPPCVFTPYATCPLPPKQNKLAIRVEAGELRYGDH
jgi:uncharacterized protein (DUF1684 family)